MQTLSFFSTRWFIKFNVKEISNIFYLSLLIQANKFLILMSIFRYNSLIFNNTLIDINSYEYNNTGSMSLNTVNPIIVTYNLNCLLLSTQVNISVYTDLIQSLPSITPLYKVASWVEREVAEMVGINYGNKSDNRRLLLDYCFVGFPILKSFALVGYVELCFNFLLSWLYFAPLKIKDGGEHSVFFG